MKYLKYIAIAFIVYGVYWLIKDYRWKEANCEKIYYKRKTEVCIKKKTFVQGGKPVIMVTKCVKYKDILVLDWKYKCPDKP